MPKSRRPHRNDLGSLFAASVVTVLGTGLCCLLFAAGSRDGSLWPVLVIAAPAVVFLAMLVGVRWQGTGTGLEFWHGLFRSRAQDDRGVNYEPRRAEPERINPAGQQRPISASEVREIQLLSGNTWVPSRGRQKNDDEFLD